MNKVCKRCGLEKPIQDFAKNGKSTRVYYKSCEAQRARENYEKSQEYVRSLKTKCSKCGYDKNPAALEFHHPNGDKDKVIAKLASKSFSQPIKSKIDNEVKKCVILCANCHREEHNKQYNRY